MSRIACMIVAATFVLIGFGVVGPTPALAGDREARACGDEYVLRRIISKFRHQVRNVPHLPNVAIFTIADIHQHRYFPAHKRQPIARRYCHAMALMSDGRDRKIWYLIEDRMGFASIGDGVEFCVAGFDRWRVYNGGCRILR